MKIDDNTTFLEDTLRHASRETRHLLADALYCHLHNTGYNLDGNTEANDVEWFAREIAQVERGCVPGDWDRLPGGVQDGYRAAARAVIRALPRFQMRVAHRLIELSKVVQDIARAERQQHEAAKGRP